MICERCGEREAHVRITKIVNGNAETHNLCEVCAAQLKSEGDAEAAEWSKAIFKLLAEAFLNHMGPRLTAEDQEKMKEMACPVCGKTYGAFLEDGKFGCADCYEAFEPSVDPLLIRIQGADRHTGKKSIKTMKKPADGHSDPVNAALTPEEEIAVIQAKMEEAVSIEDYESAARYRDELKRLKENGHG